jgi:hypothetical protein
MKVATENAGGPAISNRLTHTFFLPCGRIFNWNCECVCESVCESECVFWWGHTDRLGSDRHILGRNEVRVQGP